MRPLLPLLAAGVLFSAATARAQYPDPYAPQPGQPGDDSGYYQPPDDGSMAPAGSYNYGGIHPIPYDVGQGFCGTQGPHSHPYPPFDVNLFREQNGYHYFVGDPYDFGYTQALVWYRGNHPISMQAGGGYCYMSWPHRHQYAPSVEMQPYFRMMGGHFVYSGPWDQSYYQHRDRYSQYYNDYYRGSYFGNRYYRVHPRHIWRHGPGFGVQVNPGGVRFGVGFGGGGPRPMAPPVVVPPVMQPPRVYVAPPPQPRVYGVPAPAPVYRNQYVPPPAPQRGGGYVPPPAPAYR